MVARLCSAHRRHEDASRESSDSRRRKLSATRPPGDIKMQWQTPTATDLRFGFEITMYVAAR